MTITFAIDVDNTLLDNDALLAAMARVLRARLPRAAAQRFWELYEASRRQTGIASPYEAIRRMRPELGDDVGDRAAAIVNTILPDRSLYPRALAVLAHLRTLGRAVIFSDGDDSYQPLKIERSGIAATADAVLVFARKQDHVQEVMTAFPARAYAFVDDKASVLRDIGEAAPGAFLIHVRQGKYAIPDDNVRVDKVVRAIAELEDLRAEDLWRRQ